MQDLRQDPGLARAAAQWADADIRTLLNESALRLGAGRPTDAGVAFTLATKHPHPIELAGGIPDPARLPVAAMRTSLDYALTTSPKEALRYGGIRGIEALRTALAERQGRFEGMKLEASNFIITNGSAGGIDNICTAFVGPDDLIIAEAPSFSGSLRTLQGHTPNIVQVPMDQHGVLVDKVAEAIAQAQSAGQRVKIFYTTPNFHNPTGTTLELSRKRELIKLCAAHHILIIEDAAYVEVYFGEASPPSIFAVAQGQGVLRVGTFSKVIGTGLRVGWVQGRADFIDAIERVRFDMGNSPLLQQAIARFMETGGLDTHMSAMRPVYKEKCATLSESLRTHCKPYVRFAQPEGGFFLWVECIGAPARAVTREASKEGLIFPAGSIFYLDGEASDAAHIRLAYATATVEQLADVGPRLARAFARALGER